MIKKILGGLIILSFLFYPFSFFRWVKNEAMGIERITGDVVWSGEIRIDSHYMVEYGSTLTIEKGSHVVFNGDFLFLYVEGELDVRGTVKEPVVFSGPGDEKGFAISVEARGEAKINNAEMRGGGNGIYLIDDGRFINRAFASNRSGALTYNGGSLEIQNVNFHDNYVGVKINKSGKSNIRASRNSFVGNNWNVECKYASNCQNDFKNNWWGSSDGPELSGYGQDWNKYIAIYGNIEINPIRTNEDFRDPVILIPGIMGSQKKDGDWEMDPIFHTYENLYESLINNGYVEGFSLFGFPYQWRDSNITNAILLKEKINQIKNQNNWPKVDIVAHSMGGVLAREYIQSDYYQNDVDQLITLGTPHLGAPDVYPKWEAGSWSLSFVNLVVENIFEQEAEEAGFDNVFDYIRTRPISSVEELLPVYDYLFDEDEDVMRQYPNNYPVNTFLEKLNSDNSLPKLKAVEFSKIVGEVEDEESTVAGYKVMNEDMGEYWEHGYPNGFEFLGNQGMLHSDGDGTVPIFSAKSENIVSDYLISLHSSHSALPTLAQGEVFEILTGDAIGEKVERGLIANILLFTIFSPIDIQVQDPEGLIIGKDFLSSTSVNQIEGAYYSGFDTENEFITIPNPKAGEYKILTQGTGEGEYEIEVALISENSEKPEGADESTVTFEGQASNGQMGASTVEVTLENEVEESTGDETAPVISISSPKDGGEYLNNQAVAVEYEMSDNISAPENIERDVRLDDEAFMEDRIELWMMMTGQHRFSVEATDEAGNSAKEEIMFDSTASFGSLTDNVEKYFQMSWITNRGVKNFLVQRLRQLEKIDYLCDWMKDHRPFFWWKKNGWEKSIRVLERTMEKDIEFLIWKIEKWETHGINPSASNLLIDSLRYIQN